MSVVRTSGMGIGENSLAAGGKPTSILKMAEDKGIEIVELGEVISTPKAKVAMKKSLEDHKGSLDPQELRALELLQSERKPASMTKKRTSKKSQAA